MKLGLLLTGTLPFVARAATGILPCPTHTVTLNANKCLYVCEPTPTITYTTTSSTTTTRILPCVTYTIGPIPVTEVKREDAVVTTCSPTYTTTKTTIVPCSGCPTATTAKTTVVTTVATFTAYKPCPTKTAKPVTTVKPTLTPLPTRSYGCGVPSKSVTYYTALPTAVSPDVICLQYCPLETT